MIPLLVTVIGLLLKPNPDKLDGIESVTSNVSVVASLFAGIGMIIILKVLQNIVREM
jgi:hypothetical protein